MKHSDEGPWTVSKAAGLAGVSVRTLHHYDRIGLLVPRQSTGAGYRLYDRLELERLQHILFYREIGLPLERIKRLLDGRYDRLRVLREHRQALGRRRQRLDALLATLDATIRDVQGESKMSDKELFGGFDIDAVLAEQEQHRTEVDQRWDPALVAESRRRVARYSKAELGKVLAAQAELARAMAAQLSAGTAAGASAMQQLVEDWRQHIDGAFYPCDDGVLAGLGQTYREDPRFRAWFEVIAPGLADYLAQAIAIRALSGDNQS